MPKVLPEQRQSCNSIKICGRLYRDPLEEASEHSGQIRLESWAHAVRRLACGFACHGCAVANVKEMRPNQICRPFRIRRTGVITPMDFGILTAPIGSIKIIDASLSTSN